MDEDDLYGDLDLSPSNHQLRLLQAKYNLLEAKCKAAQTENEDLRQRLKVAEDAKGTLEENVSKLYNTAKAQITRLQHQVQELQRQKR